MNFEQYGLGRVEPPNMNHVALYPFSAPSPIVVEKVLPLPPWHTKHHQGAEGACVGHGVAMMLAIVNMIQCADQGAVNPYIRYNPWWLWNQSKIIDPFPHTNPGDNNGTLVSSACDIARTVGMVSWPDECDPQSIGAVNPAAGIKENRWARYVDEIRAAIASHRPVAIGVNWYQNFDTPVFIDGEWWIGRDSKSLGVLRGGHCVCIYGASDQRQAFRVKNSWGTAYPEVWIPYDTIDRLIRENGEFALITDL